MPVAHPLQHAPRSREVLQHTYHFTELQIRAQLPHPAYIIELQNSELARHHTARPPPPSRPPPAQPRASSKVLWCAFPVSLELVCRDRTRHHRHRARSKVLWCAFPVSLEFDCGNYDRTSPSPTLRARLKVLWCAFPAVLSYPARPHPVIIRQRSMPPPEKYYGDEKNRGGDKERG